MIVRSPDTALAEDLYTTVRGVIPAETFEGNTHLADTSMAQVVNMFWPRIDGWRVIAADPGFFSVLFLMEHPERGIAAMLLGSVEPGAGIGDVESWESLSTYMRARNIHVSFHAHGLNRLDLLDQFLAVGRTGGMTTGDEDMFTRLTESPVFMDETTTAMVSLHPDFEPLLHKARARRAGKTRFLAVLNPV